MPLARPGDQLEDNQGNTYTIEAYLGEGVTAEVFKARREDEVVVALKILRVDLPRQIIRNFRDEAVILGELAQASQRLYPEQTISTPLLLGMTDVKAESEFLALEFIEGESLDDLIINTGGLVSINREQDALLIAKQVLQVLHLLHQEIRRSYTDFQLKNIIWLADKKQVKVMDWNHVSDRAKPGEVPPGTAGDLIRFGAFFYQLLTGKGALQTGETEGALARRAEEVWEQISLSTRFVITKSLHPNPQRRFQSAKEFLVDVIEALSLWNRNPEELYDESEEAVRGIRKWEARGNSDVEADQYTQSVLIAHRNLDMYTRRNPGTALPGPLKVELTALIDKVSSQWGAGRKYFEAGIYSEAVKLWEPEAKNLERLDLWRWVLLSRIGQQMSKRYEQVKVPLKGCLVELESQDLDAIQAQNHLQEAQNLGATGHIFRLLESEVKAWRFFQDAQRSVEKEDWQTASECYEKSANALAEIDDKTYLQFLTEKTTPFLSYHTLPQSDVLRDLAREYYKKQVFNESENERVAEFYRQIQEICVAAENESDQTKMGASSVECNANKFYRLVVWLKKSLLLEKNQPALLQAVVENVDFLPLPAALTLLSFAVLYGQNNWAIAEKLREKHGQYREVVVQGKIAAYMTEIERLEQEKKRNLITMLTTALFQQDWQKAYFAAQALGNAIPRENRNAIEEQYSYAVVNRNWADVIQIGKILLLTYPVEPQASESSDGVNISEMHRSEEETNGIPS